MKECNHVEACELMLVRTEIGFECSLCGAQFIDTAASHLREETDYETSLRKRYPYLFREGAKIGQTITIKKPARYVASK
jgi:hypothetical protein